MNIIKKRLPNEEKFIINHELAGLVPMATPEEQAALTEDIRLNQQREPIVLWRGKVVDGRCRLKALESLGWSIDYKELDEDLTEKEVIAFVKSVNTRRNLTITQKAMSGAKSKIDKIDNRKASDIAASWSISEGLFKNAKYIWEHDKFIAQALFDGMAVEIVNKDGKEVASSKVSAVYAHLKRLEEKVKKPKEEYGYDVNAKIKTQAGKDWFYEQLNTRKSLGLTNDLLLLNMLGDLANFKFRRR